jgi:HEAT repeat protein
MKRAGLLAIACIAAASAQPRITNAKLESRAFQGGVDQFKSLFASQAQPAWIGYAVPIVPGERNSCCYYSTNGRSWSGCNLEPGDRGTPPAGPTGPIRLEASKDLHVLYRVENGQVNKLRSFTGDCDLDAGGLPVIWLTGVRPADSLALLDAFSDRDAAIAAISLHSDPGADAYLEKYIAPDRPDSIRRRVSFWLGSARGRRGYELLKQLLSDEKQGDRVREHALHGLSVSKEPDALRLLIEMARSDRSSGVRSQALFWLAQKGAKDAVPTIRGAVDNDPEFRVKERAVFALSQLPKDEGVPLLIDVAKSHRNPEVRKKAMFWLGQSRDARAAKFFEELLLR